MPIDSATFSYRVSAPISAGKSNLSDQVTLFWNPGAGQLNTNIPLQPLAGMQAIPFIGISYNSFSTFSTVFESTAGVDLASYSFSNNVGPEKYKNMVYVGNTGLVGGTFQASVGTTQIAGYSSALPIGAGINNSLVQDIRLVSAGIRLTNITANLNQQGTLEHVSTNLKMLDNNGLVNNYNSTFVSRQSMKQYPTYTLTSLIGASKQAVYAPRDPQDIIFDNVAYVSSNIASGLHVFHLSGLSTEVDQNFIVELIWNFQYIPSFVFSPFISLQRSPQYTQEFQQVFDPIKQKAGTLKDENQHEASWSDIASGIGSGIKSFYSFLNPYNGYAPSMPMLKY